MTKKEISKIFLLNKISTTLIIPISIARKYELSKSSHVIVEEIPEGILIENWRFNILVPFFTLKKYQELKNKFRNIWNMGSNGAYEGIVIFNHVINLLQQVNTSLSVKEIIKWFYIENADLIGLSIGKLVFYLDQENKVLYNRKR